MTLLPIFAGNLWVGKLFVGDVFGGDEGPVPASIPSQLRVPRVPIRLTRRQDPSLTGGPRQSGQAGGLGQQSSQDMFGEVGPQKIDPRSIRFTETLMTIINGLLRNGAIIQIGTDTWSIPVLPRTVSDADAFSDEIFFSSDDLVLKYKTPGGAVITIGTTAGPGTVTSVSVVTANGFSGVVAFPTTTPAITLTLDSVDGGSP